jgi:hypothetical protein
VTLPRPDLTNQTEVSSKTLYAVSGSNDPFMAGMPSRQTAAEWFSEELWIGLDIQSGAHVRRVHYRAISRETPITIPSGEPFENTDECWDKLLAASKDSRYLGLTPAEDFVDRRSAEPSIFPEEESEDPASISQPGGLMSGEDVIAAPSLVLPKPRVRLPTIPQPFIWKLSARSQPWMTF